MGRLSKPLVPDGPIGVFYDRLHELHVAAGRPSTREMQRLTRGAGRPNGFNPTTVHETFASPRLSRWEVVREIVRHLGGDVGEFGELWRRAYEEQQRDPVREVPARAGEATAAADVPSQLPPDVPGFTGRGDHLKRLDELLPSGAAQGTVGVVAIAGMPGVGKTSLALHFAHQVRQRFPDGQIFVNLRGHSADGPTGTMGAVAHLLQAMGVQGHRIPVETGMAVGLYRSVLADKRVLVVLDDAATAEQVRPLLPAGASCLVLVTSRRLLTGLVVRDGAVQLELDVLDLAEARALLATILGADRIAAEPEAVSDLARACSFLPLALRVAAANLAVRPEISVAEYASALAGGGRLEALEVDGDEPSGVRAAFDLSYHALGAEEQRLFRCFGLVPVTELTVDAAAAMTATTASVARQRLERLATAHLIGRRAVDRYACHELLREYAAERGTDGMTSLRRLFDYYLFTADAAATSLYSEKLRLPLPAPAVPVRSFADKATALSWLDAERPDLMDVIRYCAANGPREIAWMLADTLRGYFRLRRSNPDWAEAARAALTAAEAEGNQRAQAAALLSLGDTGDAGSQRRQAIEHFTRALALCEQDGWEQGRSAALGKLGVAHRESGNLVAAAEFLNRG
ncbi:MAG TPA: NB-ARC domain-containing protein, partial [Candidatus Limnocylindrales bacterium]